MVKGKLILICHYGGQFNKSDDGSSEYEGGEANALNINGDTVFDDLKLKLAEMCNFEHKSVSVKYFLPGNSRSLINLGNNKDLIRMLGFHENSVTADIYVFGKEGFDSSAMKVNGGTDKSGGASGVKVAETVDHATACDVLSADSSDSSYASSTSDTDASDDSSESYVPKNPKYKRYVPETSLKSPNSTDKGSSADTSVRMVSTPADAVKKRRRAATWKAIGSDSAIGTVTDGGEKRGSVSRRKRSRRSPVDMADEVDAMIPCDSDPEDSAVPFNLDDVAPGEVVGSWKKAITGVGQEFKSVDEFREALRRYAVAHQFAYKLKKSDATRVSCRCAADDCQWRIYASRVQAGQTFMIKKMVKSHTCGGESRKSAQPTRRWLVSVVEKILQDAPQSKPRDISRSITHDFGIQVKMYLVRRAIEDVKVQIVGSQAEAYDDLPKLCKKVVEVNPGTLVKLVTDADKRFQRLFLCFHALAFGFQNGCRPLLFLDSTPLRSKYHESLLVAVAVDANDGLFPLAIAIVDVDDEESWIWFLEQLKAAIPASENLTLVSDRDKLQKESIFKVFENAHIGYSLPHLIGTFNMNMTGPFTGDGRGILGQSLTNAAHAARIDVFRKYMEEIKHISPTSHEWLQKSGPEHWASAMFAGEQYIHITENPIEPLDKLLEEEKAFPITHKIEAIVHMMSELINDRQIESIGWSMKLTPSKEGILSNRIMKAQKLKLLFSTETLFEVRDEYSGDVNVFNTTTMECSCGVWRVTGIPCSHAVAVFTFSSRSVYDYCSPFFTVECYNTTYSKSITPLPEKGNEDSFEGVEALDGNEHASEDVEALKGKEQSFENVKGMEHSSEILKGNEHSSEIAEVNELPSGNVEANGLSSGNVEGNGLSSGNVEGNGLSSENVEGNGLSSGNVEGNGLSSGNVEGNGLSSGNVEGNEGLENAEGNERPENAEGNERPETLEGNERPETVEGHEPLETVEGHGALETVEGHEPLETMEGHEGPENVEGNEPSSENVKGKEPSSENVKSTKRNKRASAENVMGNKSSSKNVEVLPPSSSRRSEQDKVKQIKPLDPTKRTVICTRCRDAGHNKKTCKAILD